MRNTFDRTAESVFTRCHACKAFEELREEGRVGKVCVVGDLCYSLVGVSELYLDMGEQRLIDPFLRRPSADLTDEGADVAGREAEL